MKKQMFTMKTLLMITLIGTSILLSSYKNVYTSSGSNNKLSQTNKNEKKTDKSFFVGAWVQYFDVNGHNDDYMGLILEKDGTGCLINSFTYELKRWKVKGNKLFLIITYHSPSGPITGKITCKIETINDSILKIKDLGDMAKPFSNGEFKKDESKTRPIVSIKNDQKITSPLNLKVKLLGQGIWPVFEGEIGTVRLVDENNKQLGLAKIISADGYWKGGSNSFKAQLTFNPKKAKSGKLIFCNERIKKGSVVQRSFEIPITF
jgi:hypothetical protein